MLPVESFADELEKIGQNKAPATRERIKRGLIGAAVGGVGYGLGAALANAVADRGLPRILEKVVKHPSPGTLQKGMLVASALGAAAGLASQDMKSAYRRYIDNGGRG